MSILYYFFAAILVYFSYQSLRSGKKYLAFFNAELAKPKSDFTPFASIIAPCRGLDKDLTLNLSALFNQDFPRYEIIFAVDSEKDESVAVIEKLLENVQFSTVTSKLVIAGKAENESQKVHNLREAVLHISNESKVLVFVDSDARPDKDWLAALIAPLKNEQIGCSTGYRWFISKSNNLASELRSVWNSSIASTLGENINSNFCWGGSTAIRRDLFEQIGMREKWRGVLSDDFAMTNALKNLGLPIFFVPQALTASVEDCTFSELFEFTTRQMKITRVYHQKLWILSFIGSGLFCLVWIWGIFNLFFYAINSLEFVLTAFLLGLVIIFSVGKSWIRLNAVKLVLKDYEVSLNKQFFAQNTLWLFSQPIYFYNSVCALLSREISWRGIRYKLASSNQTFIIQENTTKK